MQGDPALAVLEVLRQDPAARSGDLADRGRLLRAGYDAFISSMDSFQGDLAVDLARELFAEDPAIWSAFCLEGALRRSADSEAGPESPRFREALEVLESLRESNASDPVAQLDLTNRIAILAGGFGARIVERASLGRSLASRGVDGAQITGLAALADRPAVAERLFGSLLDRSMARPAATAPSGENGQDDESVMPSSPIESLPSRDVPPEAAPWALRGHALASLELLRGPFSIQD
ncbi:hypothetical protein [Planctomycetes bacterium Poly30]|uniref:hypothetical protein n=1 Tax=Saltatorellus ferox TaxID=2528018 RepID=UPI0011A1577F